MNESSQPLLTWLHLSDLHFGHGPSEHGRDQELVLDTLRTTVSEGCQKKRWPPIDLMLVTGDIAFSGGGKAGKDGKPNDEYVRARRWLTDIAEAARIGPESVYVVPGNHDVDRSQDEDDDVRRLIAALRDLGSEDTVDRTMGRPKDLQKLQQRQAHYLAFAEQWAEPCRGGKLFWSHRATTPGGLRYRLAGLNTALLCADDEDRGKLAVGKQQLVQLLVEERVATDELVIVLGHHPLTERWFSDEGTCWDHLLARADLYLCGHLHEARSRCLQTGQGDKIAVVLAGAAHDKAKPKGLVAPDSHGFNVTSVVCTAEGTLAVEVRPWRWSSNHFVRDADSLPPDGDCAAHPLRSLSAPTAPPDKPDDTPRDGEASVRQGVSDDLQRILSNDRRLARSLATEYGTEDPARLAETMSRAPLPESLGALFRVARSTRRRGEPELGIGFREVIAVLLRLATEWDTICKWREGHGNGATRYFRMRPFRKEYLAQIAARLIQQSPDIELQRGRAAPEAPDVVPLGLDPGTDRGYAQAEVESLLWERAMRSSLECYNPDEHREELWGNLRALADERRSLVVLVDEDHHCVRRDVIEAIPSVLLFERCTDGDRCFVIDEFRLARLLNDTLHPEGG